MNVNAKLPTIFRPTSRVRITHPRPLNDRYIALLIGPFIAFFILVTLYPLALLASTDHQSKKCNRVSLLAHPRVLYQVTGMDATSKPLLRRYSCSAQASHSGDIPLQLFSDDTFVQLAVEAKPLHNHITVAILDKQLRREIDHIYLLSKSQQVITLLTDFDAETSFAAKFSTAHIYADGLEQHPPSTTEYIALLQWKQQASRTPYYYHVVVDNTPVLDLAPAGKHQGAD